MNPLPRLSVVWLVPSLFLGACGGGSGGGSGPTVPTEPVTITDANATQVCASMPMTTSLIEFQDFMGFESLTAEGTGTYDCPDGGSITAGFAVDAAPLGVVSTGDRFTVSFNGCKLDPSTSINGGIAIDFDLINGDWTVDDVWNVDIGFSIDNLRFSSGSASGVFDGSWDQSVSVDTGDRTYSLAGGFTTLVNDGSSTHLAALSGLVLSWSYDAMTLEATYSVDGTFASTDLGGVVSVTTLSPFVLADGALHPYTGSFQATGALGSALQFTAIDDTFVQIDVDLDGDTVFDITVNTTWDALDA